MSRVREWHASTRVPTPRLYARPHIDALRYPKQCYTVYNKPNMYYMVAQTPGPLESARLSRSGTPAARPDFVPCVPVSL